MEMSSINLIASAPEPVTPDVARLSSPEGAITLMLSEIVDAVLVAERLGSARWELLLSEHHALVEQAVVRYDGQVIRFERDGFMASFNSAHAGLHASVELQRALTTDVPGAEHRPVSIRIGLHSGFVIANPDQPLGRNVVLAARIASAAGAGEILVSSSLKRYTERDPRFGFEPRGEHHFKGLVGEHTVYSVRWR
jgi:adenylate cyclase